MRMFFGREVSFAGSKVLSIDLLRAQIKGGLFLNNGFTAEGVVTLTNAHVGEDLNCANATFNGWIPEDKAYDDFALDGNSLTVGADVVLDNTIFANCGLNLANSRLNGDVGANGARFTSLFARTGKGQSSALSLESAQVRRDVDLGGGLAAHGGLTFRALICGGDIDFSGGAHLNSVSGEDNQDNDALDLDDSRIDGNVLIDKEFLSNGTVRLLSAHIGGYFQADGAVFNHIGGQAALVGDNSKISGDVRVKNCRINGVVEWETAEVSGDLIMTKTAMRNVRSGTYVPAGNSLSLDRTVVQSSIFLNELDVVGYLSLVSVHVGGDLVLTNAKLRGRVGKLSEQPFSFLATNVTIGANLQAGGIRAEGLFSILGGSVGGQFEATGGTFINPYEKDVQDSGVAISAYRASIKGPVFLNQPFSSVGQISFNDAVLGANFEGIGAKFNDRISDLNPQGGVALSLTRAQIGGDLSLHELKKESGERVPFTSNGSIIFDYGQCSGEVYFDGAKLINPYVEGDARSGLAFRMFSGRCSRALNFRYGFAAQGEVNITNSDISQVLSCRGGLFSANPVERDKEVFRALAVRYTWVHGAIYLDQGFQINGVLELTDSTTAIFADDSLSWPKQNCLRLGGFKYNVFLNDPKDAPRRLGWLQLQDPDPLSEQSYLQLSRVLSQNGDDKGSQMVLIRLEDERTRQKTVPSIEGMMRRSLLGRTVGYGYAPINAVWGLAGLTVLGWIIYRRAYINGNIVPGDKEQRDLLLNTGDVSPEYGSFSPLVYSIENTIPLVKLGQTDKWYPKSRVPRESDPLHLPWHQSLRRIMRGVGRLVRHPLSLRAISGMADPPWIRYFYWAQIVLGWVLATLFVAGFTGLIHK
ncbi:MAG TPA: hypothetical protein VK578_05025 [Edaphobacter sp.]|nr:hypothetical protein [Edaphobacter sp.]